MTNQVIHNSGCIEWCTPLSIIEDAREVMGGIDLDPASTDYANSYIKAEKYYTLSNDGLKAEWSNRVWLNPPYSSKLVALFINKLLNSPKVTEWIVLTNNATDTVWWQSLADAAYCIVFVKGRIRFYKPDGIRNSPIQGQTICYSGPNFEKFVEVFEKYGHVMERVECPI
jgi:phage N-6-adenine-methyltransferase